MCMTMLARGRGKLLTEVKKINYAKVNFPHRSRMRIRYEGTPAYPAAP